MVSKDGYQKGTCSYIVDFIDYVWLCAKMFTGNEERFRSLYVIICLGFYERFEWFYDLFFC